MTAWWAWGIAIAAALAFVLVAVRGYAPPLRVSLGVALAARVGYAWVVSGKYTPKDVRQYFHRTGQLVLDGKDPLVHLPTRQWNFLQFMPWVHALEIKTGLPWVYAVKIAPIICDVLVVWLVAQLARDNGRNRALLYAVNPLSLFVVSLHGQVEPVALALALGGILLARRERWFLAGVLLGGAVAAKTWPVLIVLAVLPWTRRTSAARLVAGAAVVPAAVLLSGVLFLDARIWPEVRHLVGYSSYVDNWGWAGVLVATGHEGGYASPSGHVGSALTGAAVIAALIVFRHRPAEVRALAVLCSVLVVTAGFGQQYLLWPLALMVVVGGRAYVGYLVAATAFAGYTYLSHGPPVHVREVAVALSWLVIAALAAVIWEIRRDGRTQAHVDDAGPRLAAVPDREAA